MIGTIVSTIRSFYSATHYEWAAHERPGIGLSYLFTLSATICTGLAIYIFWTSLSSNTSYADIVTRELGPENSLLIYLLSFNNAFIFYLGFILLVSAGLTLTMINFAIIIAIIALPLSWLIKANLTYDKLLRITVYAIIPPTVIVTLFVLITKNKDQALIHILFLIAMVLYEIFAIICAKNYIDG